MVWEWHVAVNSGGIHIHPIWYSGQGTVYNRQVCDESYGGASLTFNISAESPAGFISSGSIEVNIDGNKTTLNTASGIRSFTITGRQKAVLTVKDLPDYINGEGRWLGWYVFYNGSEKQVSTSYTYEITTQGDATVYTARFQK